MKLEDWHTHNSLCGHAEGTIEDYVKSAIKLNIGTIGISDHFPYEFYNGFERIPLHYGYSMKLDQIKYYLHNIEKLKDKYENEIKIRVAFEIDYVINQYSKLTKRLEQFKNKLDYLLGSIHLLYSENGYWEIDDPLFTEEFGLYSSIDDVYLQYYETQIKMINTKDFEYDIVSHLDLLKKFNIFPENKNLIMEKVIEVLEHIKKRDLVIEINTGGLRKDVKEQYPSFEIIQKMHELDIPIILSSDAHKPDELAYSFKNILTKLKKIGFTQLAHFQDRKRSFIDIE